VTVPLGPWKLSLYVTIGANFIVGKTTVIEAVQDILDALFDLKKIDTSSSYRHTEIYRPPDKLSTILPIYRTW